MDVPPEILFILFKYLSHEDRMAAGQTCHLWHQVARDISFRKNEFVSFIKNSVHNSDFVEELIKRNEFYNFNNFRFIDTDLESIPDEFWLKGGKYMKCLIMIDCDMHEKTFLKIIKFCNKLESLNLTNCKELFMSASLIDENKISKCKTLDKLVTLNLTNNRYLTDALFWRLTHVVETLKELNLSDCPITFHGGLHKKFYPHSLSENGKNHSPSECILTFLYVKKFLETRGNHIESLFFDNTLIDGNALTITSELSNIKLKKISLKSCDQLNSDGIIALTKNQSSLIFLDVSSCTRVKDEVLENICKNLPELETLLMSNCNKLTNDGILNFVFLEKLKVLDISNCKYITSDGFLNGLCKMKNSSLSSLNITALEVNEAVIIAIAENFKNLRTLNMSFCKSVTDTSIQAVFENLVLLKELFLSECRELTDAGLTGMGMGKHNEISPSTPVKSTPTNSDQFHRISLGSRAEREIVKDTKRKNDIRQACEDISNTKVKGFSLVRLKLLQHLDLSSCNNVTDVSLTYAFQSKNLISLYLNDCQQITKEGLKHLTENCPCLEKLQLNKCYNVCDEAIRFIAMNSKRLKYLHLQSCNMLTNETVHIIKQYCFSLKELNILSCRNICQELANSLHGLPMLHTLHVSKPGPYINRPMPHAVGRRDF